MVKIIKGAFGECRFQDCIEGMKSLPDKSFDICLTDPPYNVNPKRYKTSDGANRYKENAVFYEDNKNAADWESLCRAWFTEARRVSRILVFTPGEPNFFMYVRFEEPRGMLIHHKPDCQGGNTASWFLKHEHILIYSDESLQKHGQPATSVFKCNVQNGNHTDISHWCPKSIKLWKWLITSYKAHSILDPFLGSGTTAEVCEELGIPWLGFEIEEGYASDIERRVSKGVLKHKQQRLF